MERIEYQLDENVAVISMNDEDNRFNPPFLEAFLKVLDTVEHETDAQTLVVRSGHEKIWSNGIDLDWLLPVIEAGDTDAARAFLYQINDLLKRILLYPMPTIAAITGHAFAGGAIMACAFDFRFMRTDRGFFCLPEVDIGIPFLPGMVAILKKAIPTYKLEEMKYTGNRFTADQCFEHHIVMKACHINELIDEVLAFAKSLNKKRGIIRVLKERMNKEIIRVIDEEDPPIIEAGSFP